jgi:molybdenum cofactor cytidylyltransferase
LITVTTIVLAAGAGKRLGGPKALLEWTERGAAPVPLAVAHAEARLRAESSRVLVVTRRAVMGSLLAFARPGLDLIASDAADEVGPAGSLACAAPRVGEVDAVVITPVDTVPASAETVRALLTALEGGVLLPRSTGATGTLSPCARPC